MGLEKKLALAIDGDSGRGARFDCGRVEKLLREGADPEGADEAGWTPLARAARAGNEGMVRALIKVGADPRRGGPAGFSALAIALGARVGSRGPGGARVGPGHIECALLLAPGMDPGWGCGVDEGGWPPLARLYHSMARFEPAWMGRLEKAGAQARASMPGGWTLLRLAGEAGGEACSVGLARWAMARGVDPGGACAGGVLPEHAAMACGKPRLAEELRSARERGELGEGVAGAVVSGATRRL